MLSIFVCKVTKLLGCKLLKNVKLLKRMTSQDLNYIVLSEI